jgi:hypothetical protein
VPLQLDCPAPPDVRYCRAGSAARWLIYDCAAADKMDFSS